MDLDYQILTAVLAGVGLLLIMILKLKWPAFISLLIASIFVGIAAGLNTDTILRTIQTGMGSTLGYVATIVGLGAIFGGILQKSGGAQAIAQKLLNSFSEQNTSVALGVTGFLVAIPVFFDVAFIILIPMIYAIQKKTKKSLLHYAIPLLSGLAITHAFIPPTPGPIAVADILNADLGWVMLVGVIAGIPTMIISGILFGRYIGNKIYLEAPPSEIETTQNMNLPSFNIVISIIFLPILLIMLATISKSYSDGHESNYYEIIKLLGHPFVALILANILAWYLLGKVQGYTAQDLSDLSLESMKPAGIIILLTGAGGVFKEMLINTKAGEMMAQILSESGMPVIVFAFLAAGLIRVIQGSATVAMITGAALVTPLLTDAILSPIQLAAIVISIASGASIFSHVNDSGFWLVKEYLGMTEKQTFQSWTMMTGVLALVGFSVSLLIFIIC